MVKASRRTGGTLRQTGPIPASVHDSVKFVDMICGDEGAVFADKAYDKDGRKAVLRGYGIYCGIMNKARRNRGLSRRQKRLNFIASICFNLKKMVVLAGTEGGCALDKEKRER